MENSQSNSGTTPGSSPTDDLRQKIANEMKPEIMRCSFNDFLEHYMPFAVEDAVVDNVLKTILPRKKFEPDEDINLSRSHSKMVTTADETRKDSYYFLRGEMPSKYDEKRYFEPLVEITKAIEDTMGRKPHYGYHHSPNCRLEGSAGSNDSFDAHFKLGDATRILETRTIAVACQLKKESERTYDNNSKLVSANVRIMNDDVRRRFAFGIIIEGSFMKLWYFSRSHTAVTEDEDYVANPSSLIKVLASFMYATSEDIGYDPQISIYREPTGGINYTYTIAGKDTGQVSYYRTVSSIYEIRPNRTTGRMVRIWKAVKVDSDSAATPTNETYCVLKDVWLDCDSKTEQEIQQDLFADIEKFLDTPRDDDKTFEEFRRSLHRKTRDIFKDYFFTIVAGSKDEPGKGVVFPHSRATGLFSDSSALSLEPTSDLVSDPAVSSGFRESQRGVPPPSGTPIPTNEARHILAKMRCFSVVNEVCSAADDLPTLGDVVDIVEQTLTPLELMCGAGWVHRDISCGNILAHKDANGKWSVKLSDLEYAKRFSPPENAQAHADPKTGTAFFMPYEILRGRYEYDDESTALEQSLKALKHNMNSSGIPPAPRTHGDDPVFHSFAHDLESLYWFLLWIITRRIELPKPKNDFSTNVFNEESLLKQQRMDAFTKSVKRPLSSILPLELATAFPKYVDCIRGAIFLLCKEVRENASVHNASSYISTYGFFRNFLKALHESDRTWRGVKLIRPKPQGQPGARPLQSRKGKRKASVKDDDDYQDKAASRKNPLRNDLDPNSAPEPKRSSRSRVT